MVGKVFHEIVVGEDSLVFKCKEGTFTFEHYQDCCESVTIEDVVGDFNDLLNEPMLLAEEVTSHENPEGVTKPYQDSFTWTFYKFATRKGYVDVRWYGESNGYYSESVSLYFAEDYSLQ